MCMNDRIPTEGLKQSGRDQASAMPPPPPSNPASKPLIHSPAPPILRPPHLEASWIEYHPGRLRAAPAGSAIVRDPANGDTPDPVGFGRNSGNDYGPGHFPVRVPSGLFSHRTPDPVECGVSQEANLKLNQGG